MKVSTVAKAASTRKDRASMPKVFLPALDKKENEMDIEKVSEKVADKLKAESKDIDPEFVDIVNKHFWDMIGDNETDIQEQGK